MATALRLTRARYAQMQAIARGNDLPCDERSWIARKDLLDAGLIVFRDGRYLLTVDGRRRMEAHECRQ